MSKIYLLSNVVSELDHYCAAKSVANVIKYATFEGLLNADAFAEYLQSYAECFPDEFNESTLRRFVNVPVRDWAYTLTRDEFNELFCDYLYIDEVDFVE